MTWYEDEQPELVGYVPSERPLRSRRMVYALRIFVLVAVVALVVPGIIGEAMLNIRDAAESCKRLVNYENPGDGSSALFQVFGPNGTGWQCYTAEDSFGGSQFVGSLGWIPGPPPIPAR